MNWLDDAWCAPGREYNDLPWLNPTHEHVQLMVAVCQSCPAMGACQADMVAGRDFIGVRAGTVWTKPDGTVRAKPSLRGCSWCGSEFKPSRERKSYCSSACGHHGRRRNRRQAAS